MKNIRLLNNDEISQIAAGEMILDVGSVLKELIENSIDAGSTIITIRLKNSGKDLIEIEDNGIGMTPEDMLLCTQRYATSKFKDLYSITTLGFRGEALYAIEQVSNLTIISSQHKYYKGLIESYPTNHGCIIRAENLFYNLPVRRKFINNKSYNIDYLIESYSIAYSHIKFILYNGTSKKKIYNNNIDNIFNSVNHQRINFNYNSNNYDINGSIFVGLKHKYFIVLNGRILQDRQIMQCIRDAYSCASGYSSVAFIIFIKCDINLYDVNIHPSKYEVQFNDNLIFKYITKTIQETCSHWQVLYQEYNNNNNYSNTMMLNEDIQETLINTFVISNTYIGYQYENKLVMIDQHAAHERILTHQIQQDNLHKQVLLQEIRYKLLPEQIELWNSDYCKKLFDYKIYGNMIIINSAASIFNITNIFEIVRNVYNIQQLQEYINHIIHEYGCKNAIKSGDEIGHDARIELLNTLINTPNHAFCNHGRPTIIVMHNKYLAKIFHRT